MGSLQTFLVKGFLLPLSLLAVACATDEPDPPTAKDTWHRSARPVFERHCTSCHVAGGAAPFALDDYATAKGMLPASLAAIADKRMPPWMPSPDCRHFAHERGIPAEDVAALKAWKAAGAPQGDAADYPGAATVTTVQLPMRAPELSLVPTEPYLAKKGLDDDYRCFALGPAFTAETWLAASRVLPGDRSTVHHVIVYLIGPSGAAQIDVRDAADPGPGWSCFGGPGASPAQNIGGWVPGAVPAVYPADLGIRLPPGSRAVMQVHYNTVGHTPGPDLTRAELWLHPKAPKNLMMIKPLPNFAIDIAAGATASTHDKVFENTSAKPWQVVGVMAHMHQLGKQISVRKEGATGNACLIDIPRWDFQWQQGYRFLPGEEVTVMPGEKLVLRCVYDNSPGNQPRIGGVAKLPERVGWGEGTGDEMCLAYVSVVEPYTPLPDSLGGPPCAKAQPCYDKCRSNGGTAVLCSLQCASQAGQACTSCMLPGIIGCSAQSGCPVQAQGVIDCATGCQKSANVQGCVAGTCLGVLQILDACASPLVAVGGICAGEGTSCGLNL